VLTVLVILLIIMLLGGFSNWGGYYTRGDYYGWGPLGLLVVLVLVLWLLGVLR
jgi:hypothetical protein